MGYEKEEDYIFSVESIGDIGDVRYEKLFDEIKQCGARPWNVEENAETEKDITIIIKHPKYPAYSVLDFDHLYEFLTKQVKSKKKSMNSLLSSMDTPFARGGTFRQGKYRAVEPPQIEHGICTAAKLLKLPLISLLAQFLKDCEDKKIRLFSYAEYEETIKDFIRKAPELVVKAQSKPSQSFVQDTQEQPTEQTIPENRHNIERYKDEKKWLNPCNYDALPLVGRDDERKLLDNFIEAKGQFKIWAITGPSGSGKTRLACQWAYFSVKLKEWDCRILHKEDLTTPQKWENWSPDSPTLIIIDYLYGFEKVVLKLMGRRLESTAPKIRLLLIDHVFSKPLHSDKRWGFSGDQQSLDRNEKFFHDPSPLDLGKTENQEVIIKSIIADRTGIGIEDSPIIEAHEYLLKTEGAYRPLFAALVADAINSDKDFRVWNRRELINYYLLGEKRLPWEHEELGLNGRWASHFIAVATARRGVTYVDFLDAASSCESAPEHFGDAQEICQKIVADDSATTLKPFEPDIFGESFFLKFFQFIKNSNKYKTEFQQVFMVGIEGTQTEDIKLLIDFIQRLTRNLLNDYLCLKETQELWNTLFDFVRPSEFEHVESIRWALTVGIIDIVDALQDKFPVEKLTALLNQVDPVVFYHTQSLSLLRDSVWYSMRCFESTSKLAKIKPVFPEEIFELFHRYYSLSEKSYEDVLLIIASNYGFREVANALINYGADIHATNDHDQTALIVASAEGHADVVRLLLAKEAYINATDNQDKTALIWAIERGHTEVVKLLLDNEANIPTAEIGEPTVLFSAIIRGYSEIVELLIDRGAKIDPSLLVFASQSGYAELVELLLKKWKNIIHAGKYTGRGALGAAIARGHVNVVKLLLDKGGMDIDTDIVRGCSALIFASNKGQVGVVRLLLDKEANVCARDDEGNTALIFASALGYLDVVRLLLDHKADINATDNEDRTALFLASINNHVEVAKLLLYKKADIRAVDNNGQTALSIAKEKGHKEIVKLLVEYSALA